MNWRLKKFDELTADELYCLLKLRSEVFVVEQQCVFLDMDDRDQGSFHLLGYEDHFLCAYTRLLPPGYAYAEASIGRVVTSPQRRRHGAGRAVMQKSLETIYALFGDVPVKIGAQLYLKSFYESFGFKVISDVYDEDGIDHIYMLKSNK